MSEKLPGSTAVERGGTTSAVTVPASEYDALIDIVHALVGEMTGGSPIEAVEFIEDEFGHDAAEWLRRIVFDHAYAKDLFRKPATSPDTETTP